MNSSDDSAGADLRVICGPTAAGKSALAMRLAERRRLGIISADSRQIYRGFTIGTAKPKAVERARVPHYGIDIADPAERWSAARWADDARAWIADLGVAHTLVVGGTGFYLRALAAPLFVSPPLDPARREALQLEMSAMSTASLRERVRDLDPDRAHLGRAQLLRAAEVALLTGERISDLHRSAARPRERRIRWLVVDPLESLHEWIGARLDAMLAAGWADEVRELQRHVPSDAPAWQACGYRIIREHVAGALGAEPARDAILIATRQYAKRQRTWFRHQLAEAGGRVIWIDPRHPDCEALVDDWWTSGDPA